MGWSGRGWSGHVYGEKPGCALQGLDSLNDPLNSPRLSKDQGAEEMAQSDLGSEEMTQRQCGGGGNTM